MTIQQKNIEMMADMLASCLDLRGLRTYIEHQETVIVSKARDGESVSEFEALREAAELAIKKLESL